MQNHVFSVNSQLIHMSNSIIFKFASSSQDQVQLIQKRHLKSYFQMQLSCLNVIFILFLYLWIQDRNTIDAVSLTGNDKIEDYIETCHNTLNLPKINWNFVQIFCTNIKLFEDQDNEVAVMNTYFKTSDNIEFRHCHGVLDMKSTKEYGNQCFRDIQLTSEWQRWIVQDTSNEDIYWRQNPALRSTTCYTRRQDDYKIQDILMWYQEQLKCLEKQKGGFYNLLPITKNRRHPVFE